MEHPYYDYDIDLYVISYTAPVMKRRVNRCRRDGHHL